MDFLVFVCGYEGIEAVYGPFTGQQARDFGGLLRTMLKVCQGDRDAEVLAEYLWARPEQVCVQRSVDGEYECACAEFPDWSLGKVWRY